MRPPLIVGEFVERLPLDLLLALCGCRVATRGDDLIGLLLESSACLLAQLVLGGNNGLGRIGSGRAAVSYNFV